MDPFINAITTAIQAQPNPPLIATLDPQKQTTIIRDLHADQGALDQIIKTEQLNKTLGPSHHLVLLGDIVDRG